MDQYYIEEGYYTPEKGYFVYIAVAQAQPSSSFTITAIASELADANISLSAVASVSAQVDRFRTVDSAITSAATQTALVGKIVDPQIIVDTLFNSTIIAEAVIIYDALLESISTLSIDISVNRSATITLATIGNLNSQADKLVGYNSALSSSFTQTADANYTAENQGTFTATATQTATVNYQAEGQSTLSSSFTQTTEVLSLTLAQASITARASIFASKYLGSGRPRNLTDIGASFVTSPVKFGTHALSGSMQLPYAGNLAKNTIPDVADDFVLETWFYRNGTTATSLFRWEGLTPSVNPAFILLRYNATGTLTLQLGSDTINVINSAVVANANWHHVLISKNSTNISLFVNGTRSGTLTPPSAPTQWPGRSSDSQRLTITAGTHYLDESSLHIGTTLGYNPGSSTITVPTTTRANDETTTQFLYHFDNNGFDDVATAQTGSAALSSNFTQATTAQKLILVQSNQSSAFTISAEAYKIVDIQTSLVSEFAITAIDSRTRDFDSTIAGEFTQTCVNDKIVDFASDLSSECLVNADVTRIKQFAIDLTDAFTPTIEINAQRAGVALLETQAQLTADINYQADNQVSVSASTALSATISHIISFASDLSSETTQSIDGQRVRFVDGQLQTESSLAADNIRVRTLTAVCESTGQLTVDAFRIKQFALALITTATTENIVNVSRDAVSAISASFSQTTENIRVRTTASDITAEFTQTTDAVKTPGIAVNMSVENAVTAFTVKTVDARPELDSIATQLSVAVKNATGTITLESRFTQTASVGLIKTLDGVGTIASTGVQVYPLKEARLGPQGQGIFTNNYQLDRNATISFWARRNLNTFGSQIIFGTEFEEANQTRLLFDYYYSGENQRFENVISWDYFAGGGAARWIFATSIDDEWHHFLLRMNDNTSGGPAFRWWDLWVDGVYISQQRNSTLSNVPRITDQSLALGWQIPYERNPLPGSEPARLDGSLAQIWIGDTNPTFGYTFSAQDFYNNGPVDFGSTGTRNGLLPQPAIYNLLSDPWPAVSFSEYTDQQKPAPEPLVFNGLRAKFDTQTTANQRVVAVGLLAAATALTSTGFKITENPAVITAQASLTCNLIHVKGLSGAFNSAFSQTANVNVITDNVITATATAQLTASSGFEKQGSAALSSVSTLETDAAQILPIRTEAFLISNFTTSADVNVFTNFEISVTATAQIACDFAVIPPTRAQAQLTATFAVTAIIGSIEQFAVLNFSDCSVTASADRIRGLTAGLSVTATESVIIGKISGLVATTLAAQGFQITVGDVINLDPALTYLVPKETRTLMILPENREYLVSGETRVYKLTKG